jgi:hypothetical protein
MRVCLVRVCICDSRCRVRESDADSNTGSQPVGVPTTDDDSFGNTGTANRDSLSPSYFNSNTNKNPIADCHGHADALAYTPGCDVRP